jgi:hypothetical protein
VPASMTAHCRNKFIAPPILGPVRASLIKRGDDLQSGPRRYGLHRAALQRIHVSRYTGVSVESKTIGRPSSQIIQRLRATESLRDRISGRSSSLPGRSELLTCAATLQRSWCRRRTTKTAAP